MDENLKRDFDSLCNDLGLTINTAINIFAKTVVRQQKIPFEISLEVPNTETIIAIKEVEEMENDPTIKLYSSFNELLKEVEADDTL